MSDIIEKQKLFAKEVLEKLQLIDPNATLAGGAPRDWWLGKPAKDLDFYFYSTFTVNRHMQRLADAVGLTDICGQDFCSKHSGFTGRDVSYERMPHLRSVTNSKHDLGGFGLDGCQFMWIVEKFRPVKFVEDYFATPLSQAWFDGDNVYTTKRFINAHERKVINWINGCQGNSPYADKIRSYFPDYVEI